MPRRDGDLVDENDELRELARKRDDRRTPPVRGTPSRASARGLARRTRS